jgi:ATP-dependent DNA helicase RecQ
MACPPSACSSTPAPTPSAGGQLIEQSASEAENPDEIIRTQAILLDRMHRFCTSAACRHKQLSEYFGQAYTPPAVQSAEESSGGDAESSRPPSPRKRILRRLRCLPRRSRARPDSATIAKKILSCIARTNQSFGAAHIADILRGSESQKVVERRHHELSTFGLLRGTPKALLGGYIGQLLDQRVLEKSPGEYPVLTLTPAAVEVMRDQRDVHLLQPRGRPEPEERAGRRAATSDRPLSPEESELFSALRRLRLEIARERNVPPYVVFHDTALRDMARRRPFTLPALGRIRGIGERKLADLGPRFTQFIAEHCAAHNLGSAPDADSTPANTETVTTRARGQASGSRAAYFALFDRGLTLEQAAKETGRAISTLSDYLAEYIKDRRPSSIATWVDDQTYTLISETATKLSAESLKPIFEHLGGSVDYNRIKLVMLHQSLQADASRPARP